MQGSHKRKGGWDSDPGVPVFTFPPVPWYWSPGTGPGRGEVPQVSMSAIERKKIEESVDCYGFVAGLAVNR